MSKIEELLKFVETNVDSDCKPLYWLIGNFLIENKKTIESEFQKLQGQQLYEGKKLSEAGKNNLYIKEKNEDEKIFYNVKFISLDGNMFLNFVDQDNKNQSIYLTTTMQINITKGEEFEDV